MNVNIIIDSGHTKQMCKIDSEGPNSYKFTTPPRDSNKKSHIFVQSHSALLLELLSSGLSFIRTVYFSTNCNVPARMSQLVERRGSIGVVKGTGDEVFTCKADFGLEIVAKVEGKRDAVTLLEWPGCQTTFQGKHRIHVHPAISFTTYCYQYGDCFFCASQATHKNEFMATINSNFGSGGLLCTTSQMLTSGSSSFGRLWTS